jgi:ATP-dependent Clp protease ATP-binding subunit ClpB
VLFYLMKLRRLIKVNTHLTLLTLDVTNLLLQVLDEGFLTNSQGVKVDFRNTILIMTSNLGAEILARDSGEVVSPHVKNEVLELVERYYPPEFLNRY